LKGLAGIWIEIEDEVASNSAEVIEMKEWYIAGTPT
jgi:hypothetical protein